MATDDQGAPLYKQLRTLAAEDPLAARRLVRQLIAAGDAGLEEVLSGADAPGEGRLRQVIANALREAPERDRFTEHLVRWRSVETDEFTRRAIDGALEGISQGVVRGEPKQTVVDPKLVEAYRYASGRLKHQLRNALMEPMGVLLRLRTCVEGYSDPSVRAELSSYIGALDDAIARMGRVIEFDAKDGFFDVRVVALAPWLLAFNQEYARRFRPTQVSVDDGTSGGRVRASDYLLNTIFWNLWINAQQALGEGCALTVTIRPAGSKMNVLVLDNGPGISPGAAEAAFRDSSPRPGHRGRGLLEVQEAVEQLHGEARIVKAADGTSRVMLSLPMEGR